MAQNREQLEKLLQFLDSLMKEPGNEWFVDELSKKIIKQHPIVESNMDRDPFNTLLSLQHSKIRRKARAYYKEIKDTKLRNQLVNDHAMMIWYKSIYEVEKYFVHVNYQIENMLNYYLVHTDFHSKIQASPRLYNKVIFTPSNYKIEIDVYSYAFNKNNGTPISIEKISSLWAKLLYWAVDSNNFQLLSEQSGNFSAIINIRNQTNHSYYGRQINSAKYWKEQEDDMNYAFIGGIVKHIRNSIKDLP
jgi:hypothetical protein